jgi:hypothetical protein
MIKRLRLALRDLRCQVRLFFAEVRHHDAQQVVHEAYVEVERAVVFAGFTKDQLQKAQDDARLAASDVVRHRQRWAVGLR